MVKKYLILLGFFLFAFTSMQAVKAEIVPKAEDLYVSTEDIVSDLVFQLLIKK